MTPGKDSIDTSLAEAICREHFQIEATCDRLEGYLDHNFRVVVGGEASYVLKITSSDVSYQHWLKETEVYQRLIREDFEASIPRLQESQEGAIVSLTNNGISVHARLLSWIDSTPLSRIPRRPRTLLRKIGVAAGRMDTILRTVDDSYFERDLDWDIRQAADMLDHLTAIDDVDRRALVKQILTQFEARRVHNHDALPVSVIHNDLNDANIFVDRALRVSFIDFGDMVKTYRVIEPAVAMAYLIMRQDDPLGSAAAFLKGYCEANPLSEVEVELLLDFILARLCTSVVMSARKKSSGSYTDYHLASERDAWALLNSLTSIDRGLARGVLRKAAGFAVHTTAPALQAYLASAPAHSIPIETSTTESYVALDFSVGSTTFDPTQPVDPVTDELRINRLLEDNNATCGVGRYNEPRLCYSTDQFKVSGQSNRSIHLGLDFFKPAGTGVLAVFDGTVHSIQTIDDPLDYGTVVMLEHTLPDGQLFYSLYGHLASETPGAIQVGADVAAGDTIGTLGAPDENGGWVPHLHFQFMVDLFGFDSTFPGVASPDHRDVWLEICPNPDTLFELDATFQQIDEEQLLRLRSDLLSPNLSLSYDDPVHVVRGKGQYLYDSEGRQFLDCVNNVCHVGHCHPHVVEQMVDQLKVLNTNTRYIHDAILEYAERLTAKFPDSLSVCFLVNSGSEANDLALRLARAATGRKKVVALEAAYHGNLDHLIGISSYKFEGPGGSGPHDDLVLVDLPCMYRGKYCGTQSGPAYAQDVASLLDSEDISPAAFIAESLPGCGGQIVLPDGYLENVYETIRSRGGVCIADEVQVGFGRVGEKFWGFELQNVVPDIVTLGKPIANGHPVGAVVTTREIAEAFSNGMEYFNTFGGNPVSCTAAMAVLDVIERDKLQAHAHTVGQYLLDAFQEMKNKYSLIGDVRGKGLYLGVELVTDRDSKNPAANEAHYIINRLRNKGILVSVDGPLHNVLKLKPPLVFSRDDCDSLIASLDGVFGELQMTGV